MDKIKFGKHSVNVSFLPDGEVDLTLGDHGMTIQHTNGAVPPEDIAAGVKHLVGTVVADEQARVNQRRAVEDARRLLGQ